MTDPERWARIQAFAFDPPDAVVTFADKVVAETGWTRGQAERAIAEYRRYLYLAAAGGHRVSPSPAVDAVWHAHLLFTRSYRNLCAAVLGFELHHDPATGTAADRASLDDAYDRTLASYAEQFGEPPPADLWPASPRALKLYRFDPSTHLTVPRATFRLLLIGLVTAGVTIVALLVVLLRR